MLKVKECGRATALSLPGILAFDEKAAVDKSIVISIFNHRNVRYKQ
jgi:hypothetical protein